jgi:hypothetical protein
VVVPDPVFPEVRVAFEDETFQKGILAGVVLAVLFVSLGPDGGEAEVVEEQEAVEMEWRGGLS